MREIAHKDGVALLRGRGGIVVTDAGSGRSIRIGVGGGLLLSRCGCGAAGRC